MKKITSLLTALLLITLSVQSQSSASIADAFSMSKDIMTSNKTTPNMKSSSKEVSIKEWNRLESELLNKLQNDISFPELALEQGIEGTVLIQITFDGEIQKAEVIQSLSVDCDKASMEVLSQLPKYYNELGGNMTQALKIILPFRFK